MRYMQVCHEASHICFIQDKHEDVSVDTLTAFAERALHYEQALKPGSRSPSKSGWAHMVVDAWHLLWWQTP